MSDTSTLEATLACGDTISVPTRPAVGAYRFCIHCDKRQRVTAIIDNPAPAAPTEPATVAGIASDLLEQLETELEFLEGAEEAAEITGRMRDQRASELAEATERLEQAEESHARSVRAVDLASRRLTSLLAANGIKRTADGFELAEPAEVDPFAVEIDVVEYGTPGAVLAGGAFDDGTRPVFGAEPAWDGRTSSYGIGMGE